MVKRILLSIVMLALIAYLIVAITAFNRKPADQTCRDMELVIKDTAYAGFITKDELKGILQKKGIYPIGKKMERISTKSLERELSKHPLIDEAECYKTPSGKVCVEVTQRIPILRVMSANGENYEQEVFWMRILYDYTEYRFIELTEKYCTSLEDKYVYDNLDISLLNMENLTNKWSAMGEKELVLRFLYTFITNGSPIADRQYTLQEVERMGSQLCGFNPYLKKGYLECIMLAEEYWLYTNNILAYIADDAIYNRMRITRDQMAVRVATYFPMMSGTYHGIIGITAPVWAGISWNWRMNSDETNIFSVLDGLGNGGYVTYPKVPELPITGMGTEAKPPIQIKVKVPAPEQFIQQVTDLMGDSEEIFIEIKAGDPDGDGEEDMVQTHTKPKETVPESSAAPEEKPDEKPEEKPEGSSIKRTFAWGDFGIGIAKDIIEDFISIGYNAETGEFEVAFDMKAVAVKFARNPITNDYTAYIHAGLDLNKTLFKKKKKAKGVEEVEIGVGGAKVTSVLFLKGTLNTKNLTTSSVEYGATAGAQLSAAAGAGETVSWNLLTGVKKDTAYTIFNGVKDVLETETQSYTGLLELLDFSKWFKD